MEYCLTNILSNICQSLLKTFLPKRKKELVLVRTFLACNFANSSTISEYCCRPAHEHGYKRKITIFRFARQFQKKERRVYKDKTCSQVFIVQHFLYDVNKYLYPWILGATNPTHNGCVEGTLCLTRTVCH